MALTRTLRPLILMSLLVMTLANSSYGHNTQNIPQNNPLGLDIPVNPVLPDQLNNLDDNPVNVDVNDLLSKQDQYDQYSPVSQGNNNDFVPSEPTSYDNLKPEGTLNVVPTKLQQYEGLIPSINTIGIQGVFLCKSEHLTYDPLVGMYIIIIYLSKLTSFLPLKLGYEKFKLRILHIARKYTLRTYHQAYLN